jgi:capsular polysaccharide biosynthesis protein
MMEINEIFREAIYSIPLMRRAVAFLRSIYWLIKRNFHLFYYRTLHLFYYRTLRLFYYRTLHLFYYRTLRLFYYRTLHQYFHTYEEIEIEVDHSTVLKDASIEEIVDCKESSQSLVVPGINVEAKQHKFSMLSNNITENELYCERTFWAPHLMLECLFEQYWFPESGFLVSKNGKVWRHSTLGQYMDPHFLTTHAVEEKQLEDGDKVFLFHEHLLHNAPIIHEPSLITSHYASSNYGHFMLDMVPLIQIGMGLKLSMISMPLLEWQKSIYQRIGVNPDSVTTVSERVVFLEKVFVSNRHNANSTYAASPNHRGVFAAILQNIAQLSIKNLPKRRIFLSRGVTQNRNLRNRAALEEVLHQEGFETVYPELLTFDEQALLFSDADLIVSEFGAVMANVVFCRPRAKVVEIIPEGQNDPWSRHLCASLDLEHITLCHTVKDEDREVLEIAGRIHKDIRFSYDANIELIRGVVKQL